jgi:hypothetical protein
MASVLRQSPGETRDPRYGRADAPRRTLVIPIQRWGTTDVWRPTTAFAANPGQVSRYRSAK